MSFFLEPAALNLAEIDFLAMVVEVQKNYAFVIKKKASKFDAKDVWLGTVQGKFSSKQGNLVCVGDIVVCKPKEFIDDGSLSLPTCLISAAVERKNLLQKPSKRIVQNVASNIDQVLIMVSIHEPKLNYGFLDRYLVLCCQNNIKPMLIFNKMDLIDELAENEQSSFEKILAYYQKISYETVLISTITNKNIRQLRQTFRNKISLIVGQSGVGKSSLINLLSPDLIQAVDEFGPILTKGRHTTSFVSMVKIKAGGYLIDTPGIKSLSLNIESAKELESCFPEFTELVGQCKYRNCSHVSESPCAIKQAVAAGSIHPNRYQSFLKLVEEIEPKY